jgi:hypothetical protein
MLLSFSFIGRHAMTCERCDGLMVSERIHDFHGMSSDLCTNGYRCLICGNLVDEMILENRRRSVADLDCGRATGPRKLHAVTA